MHSYILWRWTRDVAAAEQSDSSEACQLIRAEHSETVNCANTLMSQAGVKCSLLKRITAQGKAALASEFGSWAAMQQEVGAARAALRASAAGA